MCYLANTTIECANEQHSLLHYKSCRATAFSFAHKFDVSADWASPLDGWMDGACERRQIWAADP